MEIKIRCKGNRSISYNKLKHFQGSLKEMSVANARKLRESVLRYGWIAPVFVWHGDQILDGHGRLLVLGEMLKEGHTVGDIPVVDIEAKDKQEAAKILLSLNSHYQTITEDGLYEFMHNFELGMDDLDICQLADIDFERFEAGYFKDEAEEGDVPEPPANPKVRAGDIWLLGEHRLLCGDSAERKDLERLMDGKKADMVFTDPPYGVDYSTKNEFLNKYDKGNCIQEPIRNDSDTKKAFKLWGDVFGLMQNILADAHSIYICSPQTRDLMMMMMMIERGGIHIGEIIIWVKNNHVLGRLDYYLKHEPIIYGWLKKGRHKFYGNGRCKTSVWEFNKPLKSDLHPTMKPVELIEEALLNSSKKGDICLDIFLGSGSTLIACEKTGRICYGMEIAPAYCDVILDRWSNFTGKDPVREDGKKWSGAKSAT